MDPADQLPNANCKRLMPGRPNCCRSFSTGGVMTPRFSATIGSSPNAFCSADRKSSPGPLTQRPLNGGRFAGGNLPVRFKAAEMIESHHIEKRERGTEALDPPLVSVGGQQVPAINRIPPKLSGGAEIIRRHAGDHGRAALIVEIEQIGMSPDVRAVVRNIDRDVAHETDAALLAIGLEMFPLLEEFELPILVGFQFRRQFPRPLAHGMRVSLANLRVPRGPHRSVVRIFAGHEERVVVEPWTGAFAKAVEGRTIGAGTVGKENLRRPA